MTEQLSAVSDRFFQAETFMGGDRRDKLPSATEQEIRNRRSAGGCVRPSPNGLWRCTQPSAHPGIHVACDGRFILAQWPNDDEPPYTIAEEPV